MLVEENKIPNISKCDISKYNFYHSHIKQMVCKN